MKSTSQHQPTRHDDTVLRNTLLKLTASQKITCTVVVAVVALVWYDLLNRLVAYGHGIDYSGLHALGAQVVDFLKRYNPFFWWGVVALCTLIIVYLLNGFIRHTSRRTRARLVGADVLAELVPQLSEPARQVLTWTWEDRRHPMTVGDLQRTRQELRAGRFEKIQLALRHAALLEADFAAKPGAERP